MKIIADFHVHSRFSRATSKDLTLPNMYKTAKLKGINILGTGDFTHPGWFSEIEIQLEEAENGLFKLKNEWASEMDKEIPESCRDNSVRFWLTVEISNIYKRGGAVRRLHNVVVAPDLKTVAQINTKLAGLGNLHSDGRPILGLDSEELLKIVMDINPMCMFIPAHIWTPWFAMFGSKSGFDSVEEAFGDNAGQIVAMETGLSASPQMCREIGNLDNYALVSNSDAHSCAKLGREATVFDCDLSYKEIRDALQKNDERLVGTIEFYPEEGKYHADGHAPCNFSCSHEETIKLEGRCPKCGGIITVGVLARVDELAKKHPPKEKIDRKKKVQFIVPLMTIISESLGVKESSKKVEAMYWELTKACGSDFKMLTEIDIKEIKDKGFERVAESIDRVRKGNIVVKPGYDGIFGVVKVWDDNTSGQGTLF